MTPRGRGLFMGAAALAAALALTACASNNGAQSAGGTPARERDRGFLGFGGGDEKEEAGAQIGVNSFLWRASLDTISHMPLALTDSNGGVILTDWWSDPQTPGERFKVSVYILDTRLRADALKVNVAREVQGAGGWTTAAVNEDTAAQLENKILARARELRLSTIRD